MNKLSINIKQLGEIQRASKILKKGFKKTESKPWVASSFAAELCFQVTHILCSIINKGRKGRHIAPLAGINKGIDDEIADVLFNIMNLVNFLGLSVADILSCDIILQSEHLFGLKNTYIQSMNLSIQAGNLWDAVFRKDGYKHKIMKTKDNEAYIQKALAGTLIALLALARVLKIDTKDAFWSMFKDANQFLGNYKGKHEIKR